MQKNNKIKVLFSQEEINKKVSEIAKKISSEFSEEEELYFICVLKGSVLFFSDLVKKIKNPVQLEFIRLKSYNNFQSSKNFYELDMKLPNLNNKNVIVVEDIVDSGYTLSFINTYLKQNYQMKSYKTVALLNKACARDKNYKIDADFYCFEIDDKFVLGYGLDYNGLYRNLNFVGYFDT